MTIRIVPTSLCLIGSLSLINIYFPITDCHPLILSANVVSKKRRYDFLSGNFVSLLQCYLILKFTFPVFTLPLQAFYVAFTSDFVPEKVKAEDALRERDAAGNGVFQKI